ncbi:MAG TPA: cytochrome P450 [Aquihabitans sp.]|nr:cytochrome P450 [Aquihabitans sp.]
MTDVVRTAVPEGFDFTDPDLYAERVPLAEFAELRATAPVFWNPQTRAESGYDDGGFWVVSRHEDVKAISTAREGWSSEENTAIVKFDGATVGPDERAVQRNLLLNMDAPGHTKVRGIVSRGCFTPRAVGRIEDALRARAEAIVTAALAKGEGDFVTDIACELPLQAIADLVGFPQADRRKVFDWSNQMIAYDDPEYDVDPAVAAAEILGYAMGLGEERTACPMDDIATKLVTADIDGEALTAEQFGFFVLILAVAGNETTRNAISHGMQAFFDHPDQWERYRRDRPATTADEIVRWATPVVLFQRTALVDQELHGTTIRAGQRVGLAYSSANFDETVFEDPHRFDITRDPNPHVGFGGGGAHYCIGANLAKVEIDVMFDAIADHLPDITALGPPRRLRSAWLNGIKGLPVRYR